MFSAVRRLVPRGLGLRFALWYAGLFILSSAACFAIAYYFVASSLRNSDRKLLESKSSELHALLGTDSQERLRESLQSLETKANQQFLIRVTDQNGKILFRYTPKELEPFEKNLDASFRPVRNGTPTWTQIAIPHEGEVLAVVSSKLPTGLTLHVGHSSDDTDDLIEQFGQAFLWAVGGLLIIGLAGALLFTKRALRPVRQLIDAISTVKAGDISARVQTSNSGDELDSLRKIFNEMLEQIEGLIHGMQQTTDALAHDLRTPITRLRSNAELALLPSATEEEKMEALASTVENADSLIELTNTLMDVAEAESGTLKLRPESVSVEEVISDIADLYSYPAEQKKITLESVSSDAFIVGDKTRVKQAVANLVDNAIKYTPAGGEVKLHVERNGTRSRLAFCVSDTGCGIAAEEIPHIWKRLYRCDASRSERGMGLGLSLVKAIAEAQRGSVDAESAVGSGSTFRIWFPVDEKD